MLGLGGRWIEVSVLVTRGAFGLGVRGLLALRRGLRIRGGSSAATEYFHEEMG